MKEIYKTLVYQYIGLILVKILIFIVIIIYIPHNCNEIIKDNLPDITFCENDVPDITFCENDVIGIEGLMLIDIAFTILVLFIMITEYIEYLKLRKDKNNEL